MGARGPEPGHAYGAAAIAELFKNVDFPMTKNDIMQKFGEKEIEYTKGNPKKVKDILGGIANDKFNSPADLEHALHEELNK